MHPDCLTEADVKVTDPLKLLELLGGYYECPKDASGKRLGPLVGYAGKYAIEDGVTDEGIQKQFVGDVYANFAKAERTPRVIMAWAGKLIRSKDLNVSLVLGMPMGGIASALAVAYRLGCDFAFPEKKIIALASGHMREQSTLVMGRHEIRKGDRVLIMEDVCNNFSTTKEALKLIHEANATPVGIACWLNRSHYYLWNDVPIYHLVHRPMPEYKQEDPEVASDIAAGNVVLKPKAEWPRLMAAMQAARS